ncbi:hypothetical protein BJX70DRAFT_404472 [Aspergillus crustosus]
MQPPDRQTCLTTLGQRLTQVQALDPEAPITPSQHESLRISLHRLDLEAPVSSSLRNFFIPWPLSAIHSYPLNLKNEDTTRSLNHSNDIMTHGRKAFRGLGPSPYCRVEILAYEIMCHYEAYPRIGVDNGTEPLESMMNWRCKALHDFDNNPLCVDIDMRRTLVRPPWMIHSTWMVNSRTPHVKMVVQHDMEGKEETLLRSEILAILASMVSRLSPNMGNLKDHMTIPVMMISVCRPLHARVLVAYFDGSHLIIQKTPLVSFENPEDRAQAFDFFTAHLAADVNTEEDTTRL